MIKDKIGVGIIGSQFISTIHAEALQTVTDAEIIAVCSPTPGNAEALATKFNIPNHFTDIDQLLALDSIDMVVIGAPNHLHHQLTLAVAAAGKHIVLEKPFCLNMREADEMIEACKKAQVKLMYAEVLCFTPKYARVKEMLDHGALGAPILIKQMEKHDGPHSAHFWDMKRAGGGATMDLGCHAIEFFRWMLNNEPIKSVYAQMGTYVHGDKTDGDDNAIIILEFANGTVAMAEDSWTNPGGMDDKIEVHGTAGHAKADLLKGNAILTYSTTGLDYAVEKAGDTKGWSFTVFEELWNYGFPQQMAHFVDCVKNDKTPITTGEDGKAVLEVIFAAYESARTGKKVMMPFHSDAERPILLWKPDA
jgi:myo-inositol 2-dehydrogenase/D-chiro-inositol 1-dehydrogenase